MIITVILPVRNEGEKIKGSLEAIFNQDYPQNLLEILVADGMSTDTTRETVGKYRQEHPNLQLLDNPKKIVPTGMNIALRKAKGEVIVRVDGHCIIAPDYISKCVHHLLKDNIDGVGGPMETIGETPLSETIAVAMSSQFGVGNSAFRTIIGKTMLADTVPFPAYTKTMVMEAGFYDEELVRNQDDEYNYRIRELGGKILLADDVRSIYYSRGSLRKLWTQYYQYGYYKIRVLQKHIKQMSFRQFVPACFILGLLLSALLSATTSWGWILFLAVTGSYLFANFIASIITAKHKGWKHLSILPLTFMTMHLSYGFGFLFGLLKFWNRWRDKTGFVPHKTLDE